MTLDIRAEAEKIAFKHFLCVPKCTEEALGDIEFLCCKVREAALDEAARVAMTEEEPSPNPSDAIRDVICLDPIHAVIAGVHATKKSIEVNILSLKSRNERSEKCP